MKIAYDYPFKPLTPPKGFFKWCSSQITGYRWANKDRTIVSTTRPEAPLISKRLTKASNLNIPEKFYPFAIVLSSKTRIEIQSFGIWCGVENGEETYEIRRTNLECFCDDIHYQVHQCGNRWRSGLQQLYGFMSGYYTNTQFYLNRWREKITKSSPLRYCNLKEISWQQLGHAYKYRHEIEFLQLIHADRFADEVLFEMRHKVGGRWVTGIDYRTVNMKWLYRHKGILKNSTITYQELRLGEALRKRHGKPISGIENILTVQDLKKIPACVGINSFQKWAIAQDLDFGMYVDYLNMLDELGIGVDKGNAMPKDFRKAHDEKVNLIGVKNNKVYEKEFNDRVKQLKGLERRLGEVQIVAPKEIGELLVEGKTLRHCVGGQQYIRRHAQGETTILFVRKANQLDEPYLTLEMKNHHIVQLRGKRNHAAPPEIEEVIENWVKTAH
ncbi:PcfJ domain-containing protein [Candidatus Enterococcus leclercqii]|uniref:PcfJ domain-containing protein n=1 Tax=Candidatus Enterococcus leclercqii TaxID=1857218 RepID=UPI001379E2A7|nr:PcfJ domain-containing protein [Enterococcus sp. CU9D]KAF1294219.1 hypothetical protein BAU14_07470 [Enterococcus sp. CU9D]